MQSKLCKATECKNESVIDNVCYFHFHKGLSNEKIPIVLNKHSREKCCNCESNKVLFNINLLNKQSPSIIICDICFPIWNTGDLNKMTTFPIFIECMEFIKEVNEMMFWEIYRMLENNHHCEMCHLVEDVDLFYRRKIQQF